VSALFGRLLGLWWLGERLERVLLNVDLST